MGAERGHDRRSRGPDIRADRPERRGQDHAAALVPAPNGAAIDGVPLGYLPSACAAAASGVRPTASCRQALAAFHGFITYQPASRYWAFQGIETGIFVALAAVLVAVTAVVLLRRDV